MAGHLSTRIFTAATAGLVRSVAPWVVTATRSLMQLFALSILATLVLIGVWIAGNHGWPEALLRTGAVIVVLVPAVFALMTALQQVIITYAKASEAVYPDVDVFPDREPI